MKGRRGWRRRRRRGSRRPQEDGHHGGGGGEERGLGGWRACHWNRKYDIGTIVVIDARLGWCRPRIREEEASEEAERVAALRLLGRLEPLPAR